MTTRLRGVTYTYPEVEQPALHDITLDLPAGLTVLAGGSGSGKSTVLRLLNGLVPHFYGGHIRGEVVVGGIDALRSTPRHLASVTGSVFQDPETQSVAATCGRDVAFGISGPRLSDTALRQRVATALEQTGLGGFEERRVTSLSGGERQRLAIAAALVRQPRLLVLDEPLAQLDAASARDVLDVIRSLTDRGVTVVMAEHRLDLLPGDADVAVIEAGRVTRRCTAERLVRRVPPRQRHRVPGEPAWSLRDITAGAADTPVLESLTAAGHRGEVVGVCGANGDGKTTMLRVIAGLLSPRGGTREVPGRVTYLPQNPALLLHRESVRDEVRASLPRGADDETVMPWLTAAGCAHLAHRFPRDLSSGERQRVAIAAVMAASGDLILLDEPTRGMDAHARAQLAASVESACARGAAVVIATHDDDLLNLLGARRIDLSGAALRGVTVRRATTVVP